MLCILAHGTVKRNAIGRIGLWAMEDSGALPLSHISTNLPGFTPVRRPGPLEAENTPLLPGTAPWTAARCKRLLRPISSRLALLKKQKPGSARVERSIVETKRNNHSGRPGEVSVVGGKAWDTSIDSLNRKDPEWEPEARPSKRLKKTYSARGTSRHQRQSSLPVGISQTNSASLELPSPLVGRAAVLRTSPGTDNHVQPSHTAKGAIKSQHTTTNSRGYSWVSKSNSRDEFRRLAKSVAPSQWMIYDGLYSALQMLLSNTTKTRQLHKKRVPSLFSMCLRKLPIYIVGEQMVAEEEDPDDPEDVASFIYNELESFGTAKMSMREVVRAHGILLFCDAIEEGLVAPSMARSLVDLCLGQAAHAEARSMTASMLKRMGSLPKLTDTAHRLFAQNPALHSLGHIGELPQHYNFLFQQLSRLFTERSLSISWISSQDMVSVWNRALRAITQNTHGFQGAIELVRTVTRRLYWLNHLDAPDLAHLNRLKQGDISYKVPRGPRAALNSDDEEDKVGDALRGTISNIFTILVSTVYVRTLPLDICNLHNVDATSSVFLLRCAAIDSIQAMHLSSGAAHEEPASKVQDCYIFLPPLALMLCLGQEVSESGGFSAAVTPSASSTKNMIDMFSTLLCSTAQCCSRIATSTPFSLMKHIISKLQDFSRNARPLFWSELAIATAFEFAETTLRREHLDWALRVEEACSESFHETERTPGRTPGGTMRKMEPKPAPSFRWEDSICEWVAVTPAPIKARVKAGRIISKPEFSDSSQENATSDESDPISVVDSTESESTHSSVESPLPVPSQRLLSELSPVVVICKPPQSTVDSQEILHRGNHAPGTVASGRPRPRFRFRPRPATRRRAIYADDLPSDSDGESSTTDASDVSHPLKPTNRGVRVEVRVPKLGSRPTMTDYSTDDNEEAEPPAIRSIPPPSRHYEIYLSSSPHAFHHPTPSSNFLSKPELGDTTSRLPKHSIKTLSPPHSKCRIPTDIKHRQNRDRKHLQPESVLKAQGLYANSSSSSSSSSRREFGTRKGVGSSNRPNIRSMTTAASGKGRWLLRGQTGRRGRGLTADARVKRRVDYEEREEEGSEDELGL